MDSCSSLLTPNGERLRWEAAEGDALIQRKNVLIGSTQQKMYLFHQRHRRGGYQPPARLVT